MVLMQEEEAWLFNSQMDVTGVEKCHYQCCVVQSDGNTEDNVKPYTQDSKENSQTMNTQMDDSWDETGRYQSCMSETDGNSCKASQNPILGRITLLQCHATQIRK